MSVYKPLENALLKHFKGLELYISSRDFALNYCSLKLPV